MGRVGQFCMGQKLNAVCAKALSWWKNHSSEFFKYGFPTILTSQILKGQIRKFPYSISHEKFFIGELSGTNFNSTHSYIQNQKTQDNLSWQPGYVLWVIPRVRQVSVTDLDAWANKIFSIICFRRIEQLKEVRSKVDRKSKVIICLFL